MTTYRDGTKVNEEGYLTAANISGYATTLSISGYATTLSVSGFITSANTSGLVNWTSSVQTTYEFSANSFDTVSGADWAAGATVTASGAIDVSSPCITAVALTTGQGVGFGLFVPPNVTQMSQRITGRNMTSGVVTTYTLYRRNPAGAWSGVVTGTVASNLQYITTQISSDLTNLPVAPGAFNVFELGASVSGTTYLVNYQLTFS